ncbi:MAG: class I SAM-dependent methyltransferase [Candidatus Contendobacter sp.]|nr:class I SAM-dependent methyltransferase [Candidatus Contendobacter sp.]
MLRRLVAGRDWPERRAFEIGCGNGAIAHRLSTLGFAVTGIDPSESGIAVAREAYSQEGSLLLRWAMPMMIWPAGMEPFPWWSAWK